MYFDILINLLAHNHNPTTLFEQFLEREIPLGRPYVLDHCVAGTWNIRAACKEDVTFYIWIVEKLLPEEVCFTQSLEQVRSFLFLQLYFSSVPLPHKRSIYVVLICRVEVVVVALFPTLEVVFVLIP